MIVCLNVAILFGCQPTPEDAKSVAGHTSQTNQSTDALAWKDMLAKCTTTAALSISARISAVISIMRGRFPHVLTGPAPDGGGMALIPLAGRSHVLG